MDFTINKLQLIAAIDKCAQAADPRHQTVGFRMMRFETLKKRGRASAIGEHLAVDAAVVIEEIKEHGAFSVIPQRLRDIAVNMPDGLIRFTKKGSRVTAKSTSSSRKATFEDSVVDPFKIDDPGRGAAWQRMRCTELARVIQTAKYSCAGDRVQGLPSMLLIPTDSGCSVFGCNSYLITVADSSIRLDGDKPILFPLLASDVVQLMLEEDDNISLLQIDGTRLYIENCSTLVSVALSEYQLAGVYSMYIDLLRSKENRVGPTFKLSRLADSVKSVLSAGKFATGHEHGPRGYRIHLDLGETIKVALSLAEADSEDEFSVVSNGEKLKYGVSSSFLLQLLSGLSGVDEVQALSAQDDNLLVLRATGIMSGIMREGAK